VQGATTYVVVLNKEKTINALGLSFFIITFEPKGGNMTKIITQENFNDLYIDPIEQERIDKFLQKELSELSRTNIQNLISEGYIKVDGKEYT